MFPNTTSVGNRSFGNWLTRVTRNTGLLPSARVTVTRSPGFMSRSLKKTPGPFMSIWPAMIAGPSSPGVGPPVYQPAGKPPGGTSKDPSARRPSFIRVESTPIALICRRTGNDLARWAALTTCGDMELAAGGDTGLGTGGDTGLGTGDGGAWLVAETDGATVAPVWPEQPVIVTAIVARAATPAITGRWARSGRELARRAANVVFLRSSDDADVLRRPLRYRARRIPAHRPTGLAYCRRRWCCHHPWRPLPW